MIGITWKRVKGKVGYEPIEKNLKIVCKYCNVPLVLRHSMLWPNGPFNETGWKCPECGFFQRFIIRDTREYIVELLKRRKDAFWKPGVKELSEDEKIKRQLSSLGYFGGR